MCEYIGWIIAGASLLLNLGIFLFYNRKIAKQNLIINSYKLKELEDAEKGKLIAKISVSTYWKDYNNELFLLITNLGPASASDVKVVDLCEDDFLFKGTDNYFPIKELAPSQSIEVPLFVYSDMHDNIRVSVNWKDDTGLEKSMTDILNIK